MNILKIYTDGGSRGNPGKSAGAFVAEYDGNIVYKDAKYFGIGTNNEAEYKALLMAVEWVSKNNSNYLIDEINIIMDSELIVRQMSGVYKVKNKILLKYFNEVKSFLSLLKCDYKFFHVVREKNKLADFLVNQKLDYML